jgi:hypothetical protein
LQGEELWIAVDRLGLDGVHGMVLQVFPVG